MIFNKIISSKKDYHKNILSHQEGNDLISLSLDYSSPLMVSRVGTGELACLMFYLKKRRGMIKLSYGKNIHNLISIGPGFFPGDDKLLDKFAETYLDCIKNIDILGMIYSSDAEIYLARTFCKDVKCIQYRSLEPYYNINPWSMKLKNKKVLVIHPFSESIRSQYLNKKTLLFKDPDILPPFELKTIAAVQSIAGTKTDFDTWFDALDYMQREIRKTDFDVAIIGAGAYGLPLASYIKSIGKKSIHIGGATQILFGIKGKRWDVHPDISKLYNEAWVRPSESETPKDYKKVEEGCYW